MFAEQSLTADEALHGGRRIPIVPLATTVFTQGGSLVFDDHVRMASVRTSNLFVHFYNYM